MYSTIHQKESVEKEIRQVRKQLDVGDYNVEIDPIPSKLDQYLYLFNRELYESNEFKYLNYILVLLINKQRKKLKFLHS